MIYLVSVLVECRLVRAISCCDRFTSCVFRSGSTQTTKFAFPITTGMSFNRTLWQLTGRQIGREARALMNVGIAFSTFWAPVINLAREPRWGRNIETPGEDPFLTGEYAIYFTEGMQSDPSDPGHVMASACCKHYVANSMEHTTELDGEMHDRQEVDTVVSQQDLIDSYMAPFQSCVELGRVTGLMCSYNSVNGVPSCANEWLLDTVARKEWGFDGYITSDCDADSDVVNSHFYLNHTEEQGVADVLHAGTDVDCGGFVGDHAASALEKGTITEADIDTRLVMLMKVRLRLGHFDPLSPLDEIKMAEVCSDYAIATSIDGPIQSSALLKNDDKVRHLQHDFRPFCTSCSATYLPRNPQPTRRAPRSTWWPCGLDADRCLRSDVATDSRPQALPLAAATAGTVAVIGPNAQYSQGDTGYYGPKLVCGLNYWTAVDAVRKYAKNVTCVAGVPDAGSNDMSGIPAAVAMAKIADSVVLAVGTDLSWSSEQHDATAINFTAASAALIEQVAAVAKKPIVVVLLTATPLDISALLANPKVGAVLHTGQPSVTILGIAELLFGHVSPAGRTIQTIYPASYQDEISIFDFGMRPGPSTFARPDCAGAEPTCPRGTNPGRTYKFYTGKPVVPFGFGLSYSSFSYSLAAATPASRITSLGPVHDMLAATSKAGRIFPSLHLLSTAAPLVEYRVNVTNTGSVAADDVVLGFLTPPGAGTDGVPLKQLFGFERIHLKPGETQSVYLNPNLRDFTQVGATGERAAVPGTYTVSFGVEETAKHGMGHVTHSFAVV